MAQCFIPEAIASLFPGESPEYVLDGETLVGLTWVDTVLTRPSDEDIESAMVTAEEEWDATAYIRAREAARAAQGVTTAAMVEALYQARVNSDTTLLDAITAKIVVIDEDNPEPMEE